MRPAWILVALAAVAAVVSCLNVERPAARVALPLSVILFVASTAYAAAGGRGATRVGRAMFRKTLLTYLSYRAQLFAIALWTVLTLGILLGAGGHVVRILFAGDEGEIVSRSLVAILILGFTTWPIFWKSWEVTAMGVRAEQWEGTFESMVPMPNGVRSLPFGYLMSRVPFTILFNVAILGALTLALPEGTLTLDRPRALLDFAAVLALSIACMWGLGLLFGGLAVLYKRLGPADLVVRTLFIFLAGVFVPIEVFPGWAQAVAALLPMTYAYRLLQTVAVDGIPLGEDVFSLLVLLAFTFAAVVGGNLVYRNYVEKARRQGAIQGY